MSYFRFLTGFFADAPPISQKLNSVKAQFFYHSASKKQCVNSHLQFNTDALHSNDLFCLHICESCSRSKNIEHFLQKQCTMCAAYAGADMSFLERVLSVRSYQFVSLVSCILPPLHRFRVATFYRQLWIQTCLTVSTLPDAWHCRVSAETGWPHVSILRLGEVENWICTFCVSVAARKIVWVHLSLRYTSMLLGR